MNSITLYEDELCSVFCQNERPKAPLLELNQTHSATICTPQTCGENKDGEDGIIFSLETEFSIVIRTADCTPIYYQGEKKAALVHAGWRGIQSLIHLDKKIKAISPHTIVTGPSICDDCFEVSDEFHQEFPKSEEYFQNQKNKQTFSIKSLVRDQLKKHFPTAKLIVSDECTLCQINWHSYRRDKTTKRNFTIFQKR